MTFGLEGEVAELADVGPHVGVRADVLLQHAGLLAADAALLADVFTSTAAAHVHVVLVGFVPGRERENQDDEGAFVFMQKRNKVFDSGMFSLRLGIKSKK